MLINTHTISFLFFYLHLSRKCRNQYRQFHRTKFAFSNTFITKRVGSFCFCVALNSARSSRNRVFAMNENTIERKKHLCPLALFMFCTMLDMHEVGCVRFVLRFKVYFEPSGLVRSRNQTNCNAI